MRLIESHVAMSTSVRPLTCCCGEGRDECWDVERCSPVSGEEITRDKAY